MTDIVLGAKFPPQVIYDPANSVYDPNVVEAAPATTPTTALAAAGAGLLSNGVYKYKVTFVTAAGESLPSSASAGTTVADFTTNGKIALSAIPVGVAGVVARKIYRTIHDGATYLFLAQINDNTTATYTDNTADASLGIAAPTTSTAAGDASVVSRGPFVIQFDAIPSGTSAIIEGRLHPDAAWAKIGTTTYTDSNTPALDTLGLARYNYVRVRRSVGAGNFKAYAQT
jgi:hypothetical protein